MDFIPSSIVLSVVDAKLRLDMGAGKMLSYILEPLKNKYDASVVMMQSGSVREGSSWIAIHSV